MRGSESESAGRLKVIKANLVIELFAVPAIEDYIVARWAYINGLDRQFYWSSLQCLEKILKAQLISRELDTRTYGHRIDRMVEILASVCTSNCLRERFESFQPKTPYGAVSPIDFIATVGKLGAPATRYRLLKTVVDYNDIDRLDETFVRLLELEGVTLSDTAAASESKLVYEHLGFSDAVKEALTQGNYSISVPNKKPLHRTLRMRQSPLDYPDDPLNLRGEALNWLRGLARV